MPSEQRPMKKNKATLELENRQLRWIAEQYRSALEDLTNAVSERTESMDEYEELWVARGALWSMNWELHPEGINWQLRAKRAEQAIIDAYSHASSWFVWKGPPPKEADVWMTNIRDRLQIAILAYQDDSEARRAASSEPEQPGAAE